MIIRINKKESPYVLVDKRFINDKRLSNKAKGIMLYLLSKPDGWHVQLTDIENNSADGIKSIRSGVKELTELKYMVPNVVRDPETGRIKKYDYDVYESPVAQNGKVGLPVAQKRQVGKRQVGNGNVNNKGLKVINELSNPKVEVDSNNNIKAGSNETIIITVPIKRKRRFNKIKNQIMEIGWAGPLDEIVKYHNDDPDYVEGWVERVHKIYLEKGGNWAGLLRKSLRSGERIPTRDELEKQSRSKYMEDEFAEFITP